MKNSLFIILAVALLVLVVGVVVLRDGDTSEDAASTEVSGEDIPNVGDGAPAQEGETESGTKNSEVNEVEEVGGVIPEEAAEGAELETQRFIVGLTADFGDVVDLLAQEGYISNGFAFRVAFAARGGGEVKPGAYRLAEGMSAGALADALTSSPYMEWIVIPEGWRKEQIAERLTTRLGWSEDVKNKWINEITTRRSDHVEGVYYPDTYLIPVDESPTEIADRFVARFNEKFAPYLVQFNAQNIKWTTGLTLASLVEREASSDADMPLIAGILWNRLEQGMHLNVDATLQYARGDTGEGWWAPVSLEDKELDTPFNTYIYRGLPLHPIANPGGSAIEAVLHPEETDCLYYLHDSEGTTHCSVTYEEHQENIEKYLK